ncbi:hypothetical protein B0H11DRAFT_2342832 [Mycena galericulata]|nr:hypothetical protein B0H11DRAFT_2342832 [Mycena galericulata]
MPLLSRRLAEVNLTSGLMMSKILVKTGKVDVRRQRLADYYNIDLANIPVVAKAGPLTRDKEINQRQWAHLRALGNEWATKDSKRVPFRLIPDDKPGHNTHQTLMPSIKSVIDETLASSFKGLGFDNLSGLDDSPTSMDVETVHALIQSAKDGDVGSVAALFKLQASMKNDELPVVCNALPQQAPSSSISREFHTVASSSSSVPTDSGSSTSPIPPIEPSTSLDSIILASGGVNVEALNRADGLREVVAQLKSGACGKDPSTIKVTITRRERLQGGLDAEFHGDLEKFFSFFTTTDIRAGKKGKSRQPAEKLRPMRLVVQAIPHRDKDLEAEKLLEKYHHGGVFSQEMWESEWSGMNK